MCAQVRLSVIQRKILRIFVNTGAKVIFCIWMQFWCQEIEFCAYSNFIFLVIKAILRKILRISMILRIRIFVNTGPDTSERQHYLAWIQEYGSPLVT